MFSLLWVKFTHTINVYGFVKKIIDMINVNIQILRGVSVLLVLLFHLDLNTFKFGYIGVDVFFLISGFLMPIIIPKYNALGFIKARVVRLLPALTSVTFFSLLFGYFLQLPGEYFNLSNSVLSALVFSSQFYFIFNTGYFDQEAIYQPLLHTWSLGNEFFAYFLVFLILILLPRKKVNVFSLILSLLSAFYIIAMLSLSSLSYLDPVPRLFLFFSAFYVSSKKDAINISDGLLFSLSLISLLVICIFFGQDILLKSWPSYAILFIPFVFLPLMLASKSIFPFPLLDKLLLKIGDYSYSIYIWHWPVIVFERIYLRNSHISTKEVILLFSISIALGVFSYIFIERKVKLGVFFLIGSVLMSIFVTITNGASYRTPTSLENYSSVELMTDEDYYLSHDSIGGINVFKISEGIEDDITFIVGDSHSRHILPIYKSGYNGSIYRISLQPGEVNEKWHELNDLLSSFNVNKVMFSFRFHTKKIEDIMLLIEKINQNKFSDEYDVSLLRDIPSFDGDPISCLFANKSNLLFKGCGLDISNGIPLDKVYNGIDPVWKQIADSTNNDIHLIDSHKGLCDNSRCVTMIKNDFILRDSNHFNEKMSQETNKLLYDLIFLPLKTEL